MTVRPLGSLRVTMGGADRDRAGAAARPWGAATARATSAAATAEGSQRRWRALILGGRRRPSAAQVLQQRLELVGADRLDQVVVEAGLAGAAAVVLAPPAGERDHRRLRG